MKKRKFNAKAMRKFTTEPKVVHESKPVDLITQYNRMRSIATDIYNSDFFMISSKAEQKKIEASIACISATMISMIGMEAIENSHDCLPDDSGDGDDRSWSDCLPDDSGDYTDTDKASHDAIKKMVNIAYGKTKANGVIKAIAKRALNSVYGATGNMQKAAQKYTDTDCDEVKDYSEVNLGNFIEGPSSYGQQYLNICRQYGFDIEPTLKQIEKLASHYYIQMIYLVDVVDSQDEITADKYTLEPGSVFFITNKKDSSKSPVFILVYMQPYTKTKSFDVSRFSFEIVPEYRTEESTNLEELEESTKTNYINFVGSDAYYNIGKVHLSPNTVIDLDTTLEKIKDEARTHGIDTITFVDTIKNALDIYTKGKYTLETGSLFYVNNDGPNLKHFILVTKGGDIPCKILARSIEPVWDLEEKASLDDIKFIGLDAYYDVYYNIDNTNSNQVIDLDATLIKIKEKAKEKGIKTITFVDSVGRSPEIFDKSKYSLEVGSLFYIKNSINLANFILVTETGDVPSATRIQVIRSVMFKKNDSNEDDIEFIGIDAYYNIDTTFTDPNYVINLDATLRKIKKRAKETGIKTITFVDTIEEHEDLYADGKYSLEPGSLFFVKKCINLMNFILVTETNPTVCQYIDLAITKKNDSEEDDIKFVCAYYYYKIDTSCPNSAIIDLDATLAKIKERARAKNIKTIKFAGTTKDRLNIFYTGKYSKAGSLYYLKNDERPRFILITGTNDSADLPQYEYIDPVMVVKKDDSEDESDSVNE